MFQTTNQMVYYLKSSLLHSVHLLLIFGHIICVKACVIKYERRVFLLSINIYYHDFDLLYKSIWFIHSESLAYNTLAWQSNPTFALAEARWLHPVFANVYWNVLSKERQHSIARPSSQATAITWWSRWTWYLSVEHHTFRQTQSDYTRSFTLFFNMQWYSSLKYYPFYTHSIPLKFR